MPLLVKVLFASNLLFALLNILGHLGYIPRLLYGAFNVGPETNIATWYSSLQLFMVGGFLGLFTYHHYQLKRRLDLALVLVTLLFIFLSADEAAEIHERIELIIDQQLALVVPSVAESESRLRLEC